MNVATPPLAVTVSVPFRTLPPGLFARATVTGPLYAVLTAPVSLYWTATFS